MDAPGLILLDALDGRARQRAVSRALAGGEILILAGDQPGRVYVITSGAIKLTARDAEGRETIVWLALVGELLGDVAVLTGHPQDLDAIAAGPADVVGIRGEDLVRALTSNPTASLAVARSLSDRLRRAAAVAHERASSEVPARLAGRLLDLAATMGRGEGDAVELELPIAQEDLARLAGMCRESACKTLRRFRAAGLLDYRGRRFRILRPDVLEGIRCTGDLTQRPTKNLPR